MQYEARLLRLWQLIARGSLGEMLNEFANFRKLSPGDQLLARNEKLVVSVVKIFLTFSVTFTSFLPSQINQPLVVISLA